MPSGEAARFEIHGPHEAIGEAVMAGDAITLKFIGTDLSFAIGYQILTGGQPVPTKGFLPTTSSSPRSEGEYSMRIMGGGQEYDGHESMQKKRPLVSGDIVLISRYDQEVKLFAALWADSSPPYRVRIQRFANDPMFDSSVDVFGFIVSLA